MAVSSRGLEMPRAFRCCSTMTARSRIYALSRTSARWVVMVTNYRAEQRFSLDLDQNMRSERSWSRRSLQLEGHAHSYLDRRGSSLDRHCLGRHIHRRWRRVAGHHHALVLGDREHLAERTAGCLGVELGVGGCLRDGLLARFVLQRLRLGYAELDGADVIGAERHHLVENPAKLGGVVDGNAHGIGHPVGDDRRSAPFLTLLVDWLYREIRGLDVLRV